MKVLFLDVDGVLNNKETFRKNYEAHLGGSEFEPLPLDPVCVFELNRVIEQTGAFIVLSSSWRGIEDHEDRLASIGVLNRCHPHYRTPHHGTPDKPYINRGTEIKDWLSDHPAVDRYAIVDDDSDMLEEQMPFYVRTSFELGGLTEDAADSLISILGKL